MIQRSLVHLRLGAPLKKIKMIYKPAQEWPSYMEPMGHVNRIRVERSYLRTPVPDVETMWLGFKQGGLVEVQLIYDAAKSSAALAVEWSRIYGEPQRDEDGRYWWADGSTVLSVFEVEVPVLAGSGHGVERRASVRLMERGLFERVD